MVDWLRRSITFLSLISMESVCFFSSSTFLMRFSGGCCSTTPNPGVWPRLFFPFLNIWNPFFGPMTLFWNWKFESTLLSSLSDLVRSESLFSSSYISSSEFGKDFLLPYWYCLCLTCSTILIWLNCWFSTFIHPTSYQDYPWICFWKSYDGCPGLTQF